MDIELALKLGSAAAAFGAALFWWQVAAQKTPLTKALTADMTNFDWLTGALARQAALNRRGAFCAGSAAIFQAFAILVSKVCH